MVVKVGYALDVAARFIRPRVHIDLRRRFVFAFDQFTFKISDHHIVRLNCRAAHRMRQDQQVI